jgi:hypothetical protein
MPKGPGYSGLRCRSGTGLAGFRPHDFIATESQPAQYKPFLSLSLANAIYDGLARFTIHDFGFTIIQY